MIPLGVLASARHAPAGGGGITGAFLQSTISTTSGTTSTHSGSIGAASASRVIACIIFARKGSPSATLNSVTIGGVSATIAQAEASGSTIAVAYAAVPTGTTADVVANWSASVVRSGVGWWRIEGPATVTTDFYASIALVTETSRTVTSGGFVIAGVGQANGATNSWTGADERYDEAVSTSSHSGADSSATGTVTPVCTSATTVGTAYAVAAFTPA